MPDWWTYTLGDFLMFAPRTYARMVERYNGAVWPGHLPAVGLGVAVVVLLHRPTAARSRVAAGILALAWAWSGTAFHWQRYAAINWPARWFAGLFALEALLLILLGVLRRPVGGADQAGSAPRAGLVLAALGLAYPLLSPLAGRGWGEAEVFGVMPDPTAIVTLGALLMTGGRGARVLLILPIVWCLGAGLTLLALAAPTAVVPFLAAAGAAGIGLRNALARVGSPA